jgi:hypothetical protein
MAADADAESTSIAQLVHPPLLSPCFLLFPVLPRTVLRLYNFPRFHSFFPRLSLLPMLSRIVAAGPADKPSCWLRHESSSLLFPMAPISPQGGNSAKPNNFTTHCDCTHRLGFLSTTCAPLYLFSASCLPTGALLIASFCALYLLSSSLLSLSAASLEHSLLLPL